MPLNVPLALLVAMLVGFLTIGLICGVFLLIERAVRVGESVAEEIGQMRIAARAKIRGFEVIMTNQPKASEPVKTVHSQP